MTDTTNTETGKELALFPKLNLPSVAGIAEEMNKSFGTMYTRIEQGIAELPTDMSIKANREKVASYAYSISRTKTGLDEAAAGVSSEAKQIVDTVNGERRQLKTTLDTLRDKARAPLDAWEEKEKQRQQATQQAIERHDAECIAAASQNAQWIADTMGDIEAEIYCEEIFGAENVERLEESQRATVVFLSGALANRRRQEAEAEELEQLRREKAEREAAEAARIAEEERKAQEAAEAKRQEEERARIAKEAEEKAEAVKTLNYNRARFSFARAIERAATVQSGYIGDMIEDAGQFEFAPETYPADKLEELRTLKHDTMAKLKAMAIDRMAEEQEAAEKAIAARKAEEKRREIEQAEAQKEAEARAEEDAKRREEAAKEQERQRLAKLAAEKERADQERAADVAHTKKINSEALAALLATVDGLTDRQGKAVIVAIYKEQVPHVSISY